MVAESPLARESFLASIPSHIAIIMDGNGRWAQRRHLPRLAGHRAGVRNIHRIARGCVDLGVNMLTVYAFSTENWGRPESEVSGLMSIFADASDRETRNLHANGVRVRHVGSMAGVPGHLQAVRAPARRDEAHLFHRHRVDDGDAVTALVGDVEDGAVGG